MHSNGNSFNGSSAYGGGSGLPSPEASEHEELMIQRLLSPVSR